MESLRNAINDNPGVYIQYDYLMFPVNINIVPKIEIGSDLFYSKKNYHVSLLCLERVPKRDQLKIFDFVKKFDLKLGNITSIYRLVAEGERKSIIVRVRMVGLKKIILAVNIKFGYNFSNPPTHITLFTLKGQTGIGVNTFKEYKYNGRKISPGDINKLKKSFKIIQV